LAGNANDGRGWKRGSSASELRERKDEADISISS